MLYTPLTYLAMRIAYDAHNGVLDRSGAPYIFHPYEVASRMDDEISASVALLHDVVEDTDITFEDLREKGIPEEVIGPLKLLTHEKSVPYMEYIEALSADPVATKVKLSDLQHNMDVTRYCRPMTDREANKQRQYAEAKEFLLSVQTKRNGGQK